MGKNRRASLPTMGEDITGTTFDAEETNNTEYEEYPYEYKGQTQELHIKELNVENEADWNTFVKTLEQAKQRSLKTEDNELN